MNPSESTPPAPATAPGASARAKPVGPPRPFRERLLAYRTLLLLALGVLVSDQLTKYWIGSRLPFPTYGEPDAITVIPDFFYLVHVGNTGAAWSMFSGQSVFLAALAGATLIGIFLWRRALGLEHRRIQICFGLLCGGIAGNLIDRLAHGHVIDFIDLHFGSYVYPTFNVADSGICIGVILYLWLSFRDPKQEAPSTKIQSPEKNQITNIKTKTGV